MEEAYDFSERVTGVVELSIKKQVRSTRYEEGSTVIRRSGHQVVGIRISGIRFKNSVIFTFLMSWFSDILHPDFLVP